MNFRKFFDKRSEESVPPRAVANGVRRRNSNMYILGENPNVADGKLYGIMASDRVHVAVFGSTGAGKSTLILNLIKQNIERDEGFTLIDPDGSTALKAVALIPDEKADRLVYIDPTTAFDYGRVVQLNFLEHTSVLEKGKVARTFTDALQKIYTRYWGPRLDWILLNALYALLDAPEGSVNLNDLYFILVDEERRRGYLQHVRDDKVLDFWERAYARIPEEAASAVLTKIYRIIQEKLLQPMFDCYRSSVSFRKAMDEGLFVIVNLSEGRIGTELSNFLGSLILSMIYIAGMSRINVPEDRRTPHFLYVDEAYRFMSLAMKDIIQTLRKYRVYATLASHYLTQYQAEVAESIPALCSTVICFRVDDSTARALAPLFPGFSKDELVRLPNYVFAISTEYSGRRIASILKGINVDVPADFKSVERKILASLEKHAVKVDVNKYTFERLEDYPYPDITPIAAFVLQTLYLENRPLKFDEFYGLLQQYNVKKSDVQFGLNELIRRGLVGVYQDVDPYTRMKTAFYFLAPAGQDYFRDIPQGQRGGGDRHNIIISEWVRNYRANGWYCFVDTGDQVGKKLPDILVYPSRIVDTEKGKVIDIEHWDYKNRFAVEVEIDAVKHVSPDPEKDRIYQNLVKNKLRGVKVEFVVWNEEDRDAIVNSLREKLGREYDEWVKGVTVYRPTVISTKAPEVAAEPKRDVRIPVQTGTIEKAVAADVGHIPEPVKPVEIETVQVEEPKALQPVEEPKALQPADELKVSQQVEERREAVGPEPQAQKAVEAERPSEPQKAAGQEMPEKARTVKDLLEKGFKPNVYRRSNRKFLYMVPPGASFNNLGDQVFIGELSYDLVKLLGLNEVPSGMADKIRFYLDKGYSIKCRSNGYLSAYPPGASVNEQYIGSIYENGKVRSDVVEALKEHGIEVYFEGSRVRIRRVENA